jgi:CheY-like chemotaxis protein
MTIRNLNPEGREDRPFRVLVVEDEYIIAMDIRSILEKLGFEVPAVAVTGEESIDRASQLDPDLILMDVKLKGSMDGISAALLIQKQRSIPVVFVTAYGDEKTIERIERNERFGVINKPFIEHELEEAILSLLGDKHRNASIN